MNTSKYIKTILILVYLGLTSHIGAQETSSKNDSLGIINMGVLHVIGKYYGDSVVLRWAPEKSEDWLIANNYGYQIKRLETSKFSILDLDKAITLAEVVKPFPLEEWKTMLDKNPTLRYPAIAMESIYGDPTAQEKSKGVPDFYNETNVLANRHGFTLFAADVDKKAANLAGLRFVDKSAKANTEYMYMIVPLASKSISSLRTGTVDISTNSIPELPTIKTSTEQLENRVVLNWPREVYSIHYSGYFIERKENSGKFTPLNEVPYVHGYDEDEKMINPYIRFADSLTNNNSTYKYRVRGISPFADLGPWSQTISVRQKDLSPPSSVSDLNAVFIDDKNMQLNWNIDQNDNDIKGYNIYYAYKLDKDFVKLNEKIIPTKQLRYIHQNVNPYFNNYYYVTTVDKTGNESKSLPVKATVKDITPPSIPQNIQASADTNGVVTLTWDPGNDLDLLGFKVYFANAEYHEFSLITGTPINSTTYQDTITLKALDKYVYYKVMAVDKSFNYSIKSQAIKVKRPDIIPPSPALFKEYKVSEKGIYLKWARSSSEDVVEHQIFRKVETDSIWTKYKIFTGLEKSFTDQNISPNIIYQYKIQAIDDSGLKSEIVNPVSLKSQPVNDHPIVEKINANFKDKENHVSLTWEYPIQSGNTFLIFRQIENYGFKTLTSLNGNITSFKDFDIHPGKSVKYCIKVLHDDGYRSDFGKIVTLKLP